VVGEIVLLRTAATVGVQAAREAVDVAKVEHLT
jgi:hypothetical protein